MWVGRMQSTKTLSFLVSIFLRYICSQSTNLSLFFFSVVQQYISVLLNCSHIVCGSRDTSKAALQRWNCLIIYDGVLTIHLRSNPINITLLHVKGSIIPASSYVLNLFTN